MGSEGSMLHSVDYIPFTGHFVLALPTVAARKQIYPIFRLLWSRVWPYVRVQAIRSRQKFLENFNMNAKPTSSFVLWLLFLPGRHILSLWAQQPSSHRVGKCKDKPGPTH